ncbi:hypothetical protein Tco_0697657 [Tanacetum coccineum]
MDKMEENNSIDKSDVQKNLYRALLEAYNSDKDLLSSYSEVVTLKRGHNDQDKDKEPSAGSNCGLKRQRSGKEESSKEATQKESKSTSSSKGTTRSPPKSSGKYVQEEEHDPRVDDLEEPLHQEFDTGNDDVSPLDWHNPEGRPYPYDLSKPLPLISDARGRLIIPYDHFINNDLEYLKGGSSSRKYTTSITKTKATDYGHIKWIKDKIPRSTWSKAQGKLTNLNMDERFAFNVALRMYTRRIVIQEHVEDLQLAVERYQKKINLTKPDTYHSDITKKTPYTAYRNIQGIICQDDMDRNCLMRTDELNKFSDGTLNHVRTSLNDIATRIQMEYLPKRKWSKQDKQRARVMIKAIDKKLKDRRLMRSLEKLNLNIRVILFTVEIEILLETISNKLMVAGNLVKEILLKLNLPDHRIRKDGGEVLKSKRRISKKLPSLSATERLSRSDEVLKLKNFKKDATLKLFKSTNQERYEHVGPKSQVSQDGKVH